MRTEPQPRTRLVDLSRIAADAGPVLAWYEWYADPDRRPLEPDDLVRLVDAIDAIHGYRDFEDPVGTAVAILAVGGLGYTVDEHVAALGTLHRLVRPGLDLPACWARPSPRRWVALESG